MNENIEVSEAQLRIYSDFDAFSREIAYSNRGYWQRYSDRIANRLLSNVFRNKITLDLVDGDSIGTLEFWQNDNQTIEDIHNLSVSKPGEHGEKIWTREDGEINHGFWTFTDTKEASIAKATAIEQALRDFDSTTNMSGRSISPYSEERSEAAYEAWAKTDESIGQALILEEQVGLTPKFATIEEMLGGFTVLRTFTPTQPTT
jgi:hypothetical protein